jgi:glycosyltransferase involved in cell wall biosynthesis
VDSTVNKSAMKEENDNPMRNDVYAAGCKISVIINIFNTEKYLQRCLDSVLTQTFPDFELILVDDCSTDSSLAICEECARKDRRVKVIHNTKNQGCPHARKIGLDVSCGKYILFVDSDDWLEHNMLELMYNKAVNDDLDIVYCGIYINTDSEQEEFDFPFLDDKIEMIKDIVAWKNFTPSVCNKLIKNEIYKKVTFPIINHGEDRQIIVQAIHYASKIDSLQIALYHYYTNNDSLCNNRSKFLQRYTDEYEIASWIIQFLKNNYSTCFDIFEPELSAYINSLKLHFVMEKSIRDTSKLHELYPVSNKQIFNTAWKDDLFKKIILFLAVNNLTYLAYPLSYFFNLLKKIYHSLIPQNIRSVIWIKRNASREKHKA